MMRIFGKGSLLAHLPFRFYLIGSFSSELGLQMQDAVVRWVVFQRTKSEWHLGLISLMQILPIIALVFISGPLVDRGKQKRILLLSQCLFGISSLGLGCVCYFQAPIWILYGFVCLTGVARAFSSPSQSSVFPKILPNSSQGTVRPYLSLFSGFRQLAFALGPALGAFFIFLLPQFYWIFLLIMGLEILFPLLLLRISIENDQRSSSIPTSQKTFSGLMEGFRYIFKTPILLAAISLDLFAVLLGGAITLLPAYAEKILHVGSIGYGFLLAAPALGAVLMAVVLHQLPPFKKAGKTLLGSVFLFGVTTILFGISSWFWFSLLMLFLSGAFDHISVVIRGTLEQLWVPNELRGRVGSVNRLFIDVSNQLGGFESGAVASLVGIVPSVVLGGVGTLFVVGIVAKLAPSLVRLHSLERPKEQSA